MSKPNKKIKLTNIQIPSKTWFHSMSREDLRNLARKHKIRRGRDKHDTAFNLSRGISEDGELYKVMFDVEIEA